MIALLLATLPVLVPMTAASTFRPPAALVDEELDKRLGAAGKDVGKLWEVYLWCESEKREKDGAAVLRRILRTDSNHQQAHEKLGHVLYDGQWFTSSEKLEAYKKTEAARLAKEKGWVQWKDGWVPPEDLPKLRQGLARDPETGRWMSAEDLAHKQAGWLRQDLEWIPPEEAENLKKGLYKCGDRWIPADQADRYHAELGQWWKIPGTGYVLWTTLDRKVAEQAMAEMERTLYDVERLFGALPAEPVTVVLLRDFEQYDRFCNGDLGGIPDTRRYSRFRDAFLTDSWIAAETGELLTVGVGFWEAATPRGQKLGPHAARLAIALSFVEALDPSPKAREKQAKGAGIDATFLEEYFSEKRLPAWFRSGAATYIERFFIDNLVGQGGNPLWVREWSSGNIARLGGLEPLSQVFALRLNVDTKEDTDQSTKVLAEAGLVVAFMLDGGVAEVQASHLELKKALKEGKDPKKAVEALEKEIIAHETELKAFAGL